MNAAEAIQQHFLSCEYLYGDSGVRRSTIGELANHTHIDSSDRSLGMFTVENFRNSSKRGVE